jgi:hypothetical protein
LVLLVKFSAEADCRLVANDRCLVDAFKAVTSGE